MMVWALEERQTIDIESDKIGPCKRHLKRDGIDMMIITPTGIKEESAKFTPS